MAKTTQRDRVLQYMIENNGITYREAIEWTNEHMTGRGHIYL